MKVYFAVDDIMSDNVEGAFDKPPLRDDSNIWLPMGDNEVHLESGTIRLLTGVDLTWDDGYIEADITNIKVIQQLMPDKPWNKEWNEEHKV